MSDALRPFLGTWVHHHDSDMDDVIEVLMQGLALPLPVARVVASSNHKIQFIQDGQFYIVKAIFDGHNMMFKFMPGEPFNEMYNPMGKTRKAIANMEDGKLKIKALDEKDKYTSTWEVNGDQMVLTLVDDDEVAIRYFNR
ncbi:cellular retinoic acid-binding protein 1-like [Glandiceps talaboti]